MSELFVSGVGAVFSADIAVPEHEREVRFYSRVLSTGEAALWRESDLMNNLGIPIIGLGARTEEYAHLPLQWMPHVQVADVAVSVAHAERLGGSVAIHTRDDEGRSQWAVLLDPDGAAFGLIPIVPDEAIHAAGTPTDAPTDAQADGAPPPDPTLPVGHIGWLDLTVSDARKARDFYRHVVGWSTETVEMEDEGERYTDFNMLSGTGAPAAGICHARGVNEGLPPVWLIYLPVGDLAESLRRTGEEGGDILRTMPTGDGPPTYAVIRDPVGAHVALMQVPPAQS